MGFTSRNPNKKDAFQTLTAEIIQTNKDASDKWKDEANSMASTLDTYMKQKAKIIEDI